MGETRQLIETIARNILAQAQNLFDQLEKQFIADESGLNIEVY